MDEHIKRKRIVHKADILRLIPRSAVHISQRFVKLFDIGLAVTDYEMVNSSSSVPRRHYMNNKIGSCGGKNFAFVSLY